MVLNTFLIGTKVEIHHYPDWSGTAFLSYEDAEYRIPGEVAKLLVESILSAERRNADLEEKKMECAICGGAIGSAWISADSDKRVTHAVCDICNGQIETERRSGALNPIPAAVAARAPKKDA